MNLIGYKYSKIDPKNFYNNYLVKLRKSLTNTSCFVELYVLSKIFKNPIIVYDNYNQVVFIYDDGLVFYKNDKKLNDNKIIKHYDVNTYKSHKIIIIKFEYITSKTVPNVIISIFNRKS